MTYEFIISAPRGDQCYRVQYCPDHGGYLDEIEAFGIADQEPVVFDPTGLLIAVPKGTLEMEYKPLREYLSEQANQMYLDQMSGKSDYAEHNIWNKAQLGIQ